MGARRISGSRRFLAFAVAGCWLVGAATVAAACGDGDRPGSSSGGASGGSSSGSSGASGEAGRDGTAGDGSPAEGGPAVPDAALSCPLALEGPVVAETEVAAATPVPQGGPIAAGKYFLTAAQVFTGGEGGASTPDGTLLRGVLVVTADTMTIAESGGEGDAGANARVTAYEYVVGDAGLERRPTCPKFGALVRVPHSATPQELQLHVAKDFVETFTKQ